MFFKVRDIDGERSKNGGGGEWEVSSVANRATSGYSLTFLWPYFPDRERERESESVRVLGTGRAKVTAVN